jgi:hypothetical protein
MSNIQGDSSTMRGNLLATTFFLSGGNIVFTQPISFIGIPSKNGDNRIE